MAPEVTCRTARMPGAFGLTSPLRREMISNLVMTLILAALLIIMTVTICLAVGLKQPPSRPGTRNESKGPVYVSTELTLTSSAHLTSV